MATESETVETDPETGQITFWGEWCTFDVDVVDDFEAE